MPSRKRRSRDFRRSRRRPGPTERSCSLGQAAGGEGLSLQPISGGKLEFNDWAAQKPEANALPPGKFPGTKTALGQARCAAYFSEKGRDLSGMGKLEEARFMSQQAEKAMAGGPLDAPCQTGAAEAGPGPDSQKAGPQDRAAAVNEVLAQYNAKIKELLNLSQRLAEIRKQKIEAETGLQEGGRQNRRSQEPGRGGHQARGKAEVRRPAQRGPGLAGPVGEPPEGGYPRMKTPV